MSKSNNLTYYQRSRDKILSKAKDKYKNLSEEDKNKEREYAKNRYHNMSEEKKQYVSYYSHCSFFIVTNFEIWVYKGMIIYFLLVT